MHSGAGEERTMTSGTGEEKTHTHTHINLAERVAEPIVDVD